MSDAEWAGITSYILGDGAISQVEAFTRNPETGEVGRVVLSDDTRVGFKAGADIPEEFTLLGIAEDYREPATAWEVWVNGEEWGTVTADTTEASILQPAPAEADDE